MILFYFKLIDKSDGDCTPHKNSLPNFNETIKPKPSANLSNVIVKIFEHKIDNNLVYGRIVYINNAQSTLTVLQPNGNGLDNGCDNDKTYPTSHTAAIAGNCEIATNAGFFNTHTHECVGNIINNRRVYRNSGGIRNANFGIKTNGELFFGYLGAVDVVHGGFQLLISGVVWLLRNGTSMVSESISSECDASQDTGSLSHFAKVLSARTAVGATANGTVVLVHVDGKTDNGGINLWQLAVLLRNLGVVSAINLDGGGSSTLLVNGTLVSYPSDGCGLFTCERAVSTVLCVQARCALPCPPQSYCVAGFCVPYSRWESYYRFLYGYWRRKFVFAAALTVLFAFVAVVALIVLIVHKRHTDGVMRRAKNIHQIFHDDVHVHFESRLLIGNDSGREEEF